MQLKLVLTRLGNRSFHRVRYQHPSDNHHEVRNLPVTSQPSYKPTLCKRSPELPRGRKGRKNIFIIYSDTAKARRPNARRFLLLSVGKFHLAVLFLKALALFTLKTRVKAWRSGAEGWHRHGIARGALEKGLESRSTAGSADGGILMHLSRSKPSLTKSTASPQPGTGLCRAGGSPARLARLPSQAEAAVKRLCPTPRNLRRWEAGV